jgi:hypothetical protein
MPSFDIVSEVDHHEVTNAVDQANREIGTRFDFRGVDASFQLNKLEITLLAEAEFQIQQMLEILQNKLFKRNIDIACMEYGEIVLSGKQSKMEVTLREGIEILLAKKIVKMIKDEKLKVQASIQGDQVRVTGKKRDDLQAVMAMLKQADLDMPLQYKNFRD